MVTAWDRRGRGAAILKGDSAEVVFIASLSLQPVHQRCERGAPALEMGDVLCEAAVDFLCHVCPGITGLRWLYCTRHRVSVVVGVEDAEMHQAAHDDIGVETRRFDGGEGSGHGGHGVRVAVHHCLVHGSRARVGEVHDLDIETVEGFANFLVNGLL